MATSPISASGSIDVNGIVSALMNVEREPLQRIASNTQGVRSTISEVGKLQSALDKFRTSATSLARADTWKVATATSADDKAVGIKAATGALQGSYAVKVDQLAANQTVVSQAMASPQSVIGGGTLTIQMGTQAEGGGFTADTAREAITITIGPGATMQEVSRRLNLASPGIGASLVTDSNGTRLMLRGAQSGAEQAFQITATADGTAGTGENPPTLPGRTFAALSLADLAYSPGQANGNVTRTQTAANARFELNGLALESASNNPDGVLENISLSFRQVTTEPVSLDVSSDSETIRTNLDEFVTSYNELNTLIRSQTRYDAETQTAGPLQGNRMVLMVQSQMREMLRAVIPEKAAEGVTTAAAGAAGQAGDVAAGNGAAGDATAAATSTGKVSVQRLSDLGISVGRDGSLSVDSSKLDLAAANPAGLQHFFSAGGVDTAQHGFARRFDTLIGNFVDTDGAITGMTEALRGREKALLDQQDRFERRLSDIETRLMRQYTTLDANVTAMQGALASVSRL